MFCIKTIKRIFCIWLVLGFLFSHQVQAYDPYRTLRGGQITSARAYSTFDSFTAQANPAAVNSARKLEEGEFGVTLADSDSFFSYTPIDGIRSDLEKLVDEANESLGGSQLDLADRAQILQKEVEDIISRLQDLGNIVTYSLSAQPLGSLVWTSKHIQGTLYVLYQKGSIDVNGNYIPYAATLRVRGASVGLSSQCGVDNSFEIGDLVVDPSRCRIETESSLDVLAITAFSQISLGYSRLVYDADEGVRFTRGKFSLPGQVVVGFRANRYAFRTNHTRFQIGIQENANLDFERISSDLHNDGKHIQGVDFDIGAQYLLPRLALGLTYENINTKAIVYPTGEKITPGNPFSAHATWLFVPESNNWGLKIHNDFVGQNDPFGNEHRWRTVSFGYTSENLIPGFDIGKRWNLAGNKLRYTTFALKLFEIVRVQIAVSDKRIRLGEQNTKVPISAAGGISIGFDF